MFDKGICGDDMISDVYESNCDHLGCLGRIIGNNILMEIVFLIMLSIRKLFGRINYEIALVYLKTIDHQ